MGQVAARRVLLIAGSITVVAAVATGVGWGVRTLLTRGDYETPLGERAKDPAKLLLAQMDSEAQPPTGMALPVAHSAEGIRKPHPRLELGTKEIRLFGDVIGPMPPPDATALSSNVLTGPAEWGYGVAADAGRSARTLELAVDGAVRFGVVLDAILQLMHAEWQPTLLLVADESGALRVFPMSPQLTDLAITVDASGAHVDPADGGVSGCTWQRDTPTTSFPGCIAKRLMRRHSPVSDPDHDASPEEGDELTALTTLMLASKQRFPPTVAVAPTRDARWADVIAIVDACAGAPLQVGLGIRGDGTL